MKQLTLPFVLALIVAACGGGATGPTPIPSGPPQNGVSPPAGATIWAFAYRTFSTTTCPGPVATPTDGGLVTMAVAPDGRTLSLTGLTESTITIPTIASDSAGKWLWEQAAPGAGSYLRITFRFSTPLHAEGEVLAFRTILADNAGNVCSATWPIVLDRQG